MRVRLLLCALALASCGADNILAGSLSEVFPLDISRVELARNDEAFQLTYFRNRGVFLDVVARISVSLQPEDGAVTEDGGVAWILPGPGVKIPLQGEYRPGNPRCAVTTAPGGEPVRNLPRVNMGDIQFSEGGGLGEKTKGNFSMVFEQEGGDIGFGRTLTGNFLGEVLDAGFGELP